MTKKSAVIVSCSLALVYAVVLCCCGVFGANISAWFMSWIPTFLKITAIIAGGVIVVALPIRIQFALAKRQERIESIITQRKLSMTELRQRRLDEAAGIAERVIKYE